MPNPLSTDDLKADVSLFNHAGKRWGLLVHSFSFMHPLLEDIFKEPRLRIDPTHLALVLLPPEHTLPSEPRSFDFLANHVIATSWQTILEQTKIAPRPSLSASVLSHISPRRRHLNTTTTGSMLRNGIRSRSKSTLISTESSSSAHRSASSSSGTCLTTIQGKSVVLHHRTVIFGCQKLAVTREAIFHDENDLPTHLMLYLDQEIKDLSNPMRPAEENHLTCMQKTEDVINQVKVMLQKAFNSSHPKVRQFCDAALQETNLGVLHTLAKHLLDEGFQYIEEYLEKTSGISYMDQEEAYRVCERWVLCNIATLMLM
ncbi:hypothetical protein BX666DRAFT_938217 [Dichotomocladium elegans]|nr:hypothetical protein BX666DRAFT_938217 [Dichotomocladium elegans]